MTALSLLDRIRLSWTNRYATSAEPTQEPLATNLWDAWLKERTAASFLAYMSEEHTEETRKAAAFEFITRVGEKELPKEKMRHPAAEHAVTTSFAAASVALRWTPLLDSDAVCAGLMQNIVMCVYGRLLGIERIAAIAAMFPESMSPDALAVVLRFLLRQLRSDETWSVTKEWQRILAITEQLADMRNPPGLTPEELIRLSDKLIADGKPYHSLIIQRRIGSA